MTEVRRGWAAPFLAFFARSGQDVADIERAYLNGMSTSE
jgi:hypothetical protein